MAAAHHHRMDSSFIFIHVGQAGIQFGNAIWELYNMEHCIDPKGDYLSGDACHDENMHHDAIYLHANNNKSDKHIPSAVMLDLEPDVIDQIKTGVYRNLFHPNALINGYEDASNNFARGFYSIGKDVMPRLQERIRKNSEQMESVRGILFTHSMGGGTGSGSTASALLDVKEAYSKTLLYQWSIVPSQQLTSAVVEPYNALLHTHYTTNTDMNMLFDNESLYNMCRTKLKNPTPSYTNINRVLAQVMSHITLTERYNGTLNTDLADLKTNLIPFPSLHFPILNTAPLVPPGYGEMCDPNLISILRDLYNEDTLMVACPNVIEENARLMWHKYFSCALLFRGNFQPREIHETIQKVRPTLPFFNWCTTGFRIGLCEFPVVVPPYAGFGEVENNVTMLSNTTAVSQVFRRLYEKFEQLFMQSAFLHWYEKEGMPREDWEDAVETIHELLVQYQGNLEDEGTSFAEEVVDVEEVNNANFAMDSHLQLSQESENFEVKMMNFKVGGERARAPRACRTW